MLIRPHLVALCLALALATATAQASTGRWYSGITVGLGATSVLDVSVPAGSMSLRITDAFGDHYFFSYEHPEKTQGDPQLGFELAWPILQRPVTVGVFAASLGSQVTSLGPFVGTDVGRLNLAVTLGYNQYSYADSRSVGVVKPAWAGDPGMGLYTTGYDLIFIRPGTDVRAAALGSAEGFSFGLRAAYPLNDRLQFVAYWTRLQPVTMPLKVEFTAGGRDVTPVMTVLSGSPPAEARIHGGNVLYIGLSYTF